MIRATIIILLTIAGAAWHLDRPRGGAANRRPAYTEPAPGCDTTIPVWEQTEACDVPGGTYPAPIGR